MTPLSARAGLALFFIASSCRAEAQELATWSGHNRPVLSLAVALDGKTALSGGSDGSMILWDLATGGNLSSWPGSDAGILSVAFMPDGKRAVTGGADGMVRVWQLPGVESSQWGAHQGPVTAFALAPGGRYVATGGRDALRRFWKVADGEAVVAWKKRENAAVVSAAFAGDGRVVAFGSDDGTVRVCDVATEGRDVTPPCDVYSLGQCFQTLILPDGKNALSGCANGSLLKWDLATAKERSVAESGGGRIRSIAVSPDGRLALSGGDDQTVRLWDVAGMAMVAAWRTHQGPVTAVVFSSDGKTALSASEDKTIKVWDVLGELACAAKFAAGRTLLEAGQREEARQQMEQALACRPDNLEHLNWLGSVYYELGRFDKAAETLQKAVARSRNEAWYYYLGRSLLELGRFPQARDALREGLSESPLNNRGVDRRVETRGLLDRVDEYQRHMDAASAALAAGQFKTAVAESELALGRIEMAQAKVLRDEAAAALAAEAEKARSRRRMIRGAALAAAVIILAAGLRQWRKMKAARAEAEDADKPA